VPRYRYTTVDTRGKTVTGVIDAAGPEGALEKLAQLGIPENTITLEEELVALGEVGSPGSPRGRLSAEEAAQLAGHAAGLAQAGLPLGEGLRALAEELPRPRLQAALRRIADSVDAGQPLGAAVAAQGRRLPEYLQCMLTASAASGRFSQVLQQLSTVERNRVALARRLRLMLAYPAFLLVAVVFLMLFLSMVIVPQFGKIFADFGTDLPVITQLIMRVFSPIGGLVVLAAFAALVLGLLLAAGLKSRVAWAQRIAYWIPLVGPCWRFRGLAEFSRMMALLLDLQVPLPQALRAMAGGSREADVRAACRHLADCVEAGVPFSEALARFNEFPVTFRPLVEWGERQRALGDAMRGITEMCEGRLRFQSLLMEAVLLPGVLVLVAFSVGLVIIGLFLPLIALIQKLS
jgi:type II secretory pathway component PulF